MSVSGLEQPREFLEFRHSTFKMYTETSVIHNYRCVNALRFGAMRRKPKGTRKL